MKPCETLKQALGCYFHQDWTDEFESEDAAFGAMRRDLSSRDRQLAMREIDEVLSSQVSDEMLAVMLVDQFGCYLDPTYRSLTVRQWLTECRSALNLPVKQ